LIGLLAFQTLCAHVACAQQSGHYIGGATGLENGTAAPPGFFGTFLPVVEDVNALKGPGGAKAPGAAAQPAGDDTAALARATQNPVRA
jgi:hypothetical protein